MKRLLLIISLICFHLSICFAQTVAEVTKQINQVKRDTMYIYAEATMKDLTEAYNGARAILEMKVGDWVRSQHPKEGVELCIVKAKEHFLQLETRRGDFFRAFVYVKKTDIMPVTDKNEVTIFEVAPIEEETSATKPAFVMEESSVEAEKIPAVELTAEEKRMTQITSFYDVEPYIKDLKNKKKLKEYGKYASMPQNEDCHLFVYDKQGKITALLRKSGNVQYNLKTLKEDNIKNYKNCGAIWFQLKTTEQ